MGAPAPCVVLLAVSRDVIAATPGMGGLKWLGNVSYVPPPDNSALGRKRHSNAQAELYKRLEIAMSVIPEYPYAGAEPLVKQMFPEVVRQDARIAHNISIEEHQYQAEYYPFEYYNAILYFYPAMWRSMRMLSPHRSYMTRNGYDDFHLMLATCRAVLDQYAVVKHCIEWLNENVTAGAFMHYLPGALLLIDDTSGLEIGMRYSEPRKSVGPMLSLFRQASTTLGAMALLPKEKPYIGHGFRILFEQVNKSCYVVPAFTLQWVRDDPFVIWC